MGLFPLWGFTVWMQPHFIISHVSERHRVIRCKDQTEFLSWPIQDISAMFQHPKIQQSANRASFLSKGYPAVLGTL